VAIVPLRCRSLREPETSQALQGVLEEAGAVFHTGATVTKVTRSGSRRHVTLVENRSEHTIAAEHVLVATAGAPTPMTWDSTTPV
jgi:phytoene dehydrogenase-like protein